MSHFETPEQRTIRLLRQQMNIIEEQKSSAAQYARQLAEQARRVILDQQLADQHARFMEEQQQQQNYRLSESLQSLDRQVREQEQAHYRQIQQLQEQHRQETAHQTAQIQQAAEQLRQGIQQSRQEIERLRTETADAMGKLRAEQQADIAWLRGEIQDTNRRIDAIQAVTAQNAGLAEYWVQQAERLVADVRGNGRPEKFLPEEWHRLQQVLQDARDDLAGHREQAAVSGGRTSFRDALTLRTRLAEEELRWQKTLGAVRTLEQEILRGQQQAEQTVYELEIEGETIRDDNGADYWTYGQFSVLAERIRQAREQLNADTENLSTEQLLTLEQTMTSLLAELNLLQNAAADNFAMAQGRFGLAERIGQVLGDEYQMVDADGDFFSREPRDEYHARFYNPETRQTAVVVITPLVGEDGRVTNHAEVLVDTPTNDTGFCESLSEAVAARMQKTDAGFKLPCSGAYGAEVGQEARRMGDISAVSEGVQTARSVHAVTGEQGQPTAAVQST